MERKLAEFRARKKAQTEATKPAVIQSEMKVISDDHPAVTVDSAELKPNTCPKSPPKQDHDLLLDTTSGCWLQRLVLTHLTLFKVLLWLVLLGLFSELEFGLPFFSYLYSTGSMRASEAQKPDSLEK